MRNEDSSMSRRAEAPGGQPLGETSVASEPVAEGAASSNLSASSDENADKELLCTICGLRACWQ